MSKAGEAAAVWGELCLPRNKEGRVPAIVLAHGCGGLGPNMQPWADELIRVGFAALIVDSYGGRKLKETCTGKQRINLGSRGPRRDLRSGLRRLPARSPASCRSTSRYQSLDHYRASPK
jgi:dienelactone hydrolase